MPMGGPPCASNVSPRAPVSTSKAPKSRQQQEHHKGPGAERPLTRQTSAFKRTIISPKRNIVLPTQLHRNTCKLASVADGNAAAVHFAATPDNFGSLALLSQHIACCWQGCCARFKRPHSSNNSVHASRLNEALLCLYFLLFRCSLKDCC